ncbi:MAG: hypothetical protein NFW16_10520, partial [Candidatus Accumulibacter sp.]|uniref:SdrD B-like domain-containing protein n=1 Tax=Accumulibacter sp. TaxID=2053492 RepID=UPI00258EC093
MAQPIVSIFVNIYPGLALEPSLLDIQITSNSVLNPNFPPPPPNSTLYDAFCLVPDTTILTNTSYSANLYSTYELGTLATGMPTLGNPDGYLQNLDSINWLLNTYQSTTLPNGNTLGLYSYSEIQAAIWKLMGEDWTTPTAQSFLNMATVQAADVEGSASSLYELALAHDGYVPGLNQKMGIILDPFKGTTHYQPLIIEVVAASLGDRLWVDTNHNGQQDDGPTGISGQTVTLIGGGGDWVINGIGDTTTTTTTGVDGFYQFTGLTPGVEYQVQFAAPSGYLFTGQNVGNDASDSDADTTTGKTQIVTLGSGEHNPTLDAGVVIPPASLGNYVWYDNNADGQQNEA